MRRGRIILATVLIYAIAGGSLASAQNNSSRGRGNRPAELELSAITSTVTINNFIFSPATTTLSVTVGHTGGPAGYFLTVSRGGSSTFDPREMSFQGASDPLYPPLQYNIYTPHPQKYIIARDLSVPVSNQQVIKGSFGNSGSSYNTEQHAFTVRVPAEQFVQRGIYHDQVEISLYEGRQLDPDRLVLVGRETVTIISETPVVGEIGISGHTDYTMDFGMLQSGSSRGAVLQYRTNAGFQIDVTSENDGTMVNTDRPESDPIPYQLTVDGTTVDLTTSSVVGQDLSVGTTIDFVSLPLNVTIGTIGQVLPGRFQDVVTFTISNF